jgi:hypothetical protein
VIDLQRAEGDGELEARLWLQELNRSLGYVDRGRVVNVRAPLPLQG